METKPCDILISTPKIILNFLKQNIFNLKRLCHLVLDDCQLTMETHLEEVNAILKVANEMLQHRSFDNTIQMIVSGDQWSPSLEPLLKSIHNFPMVFIANPLEAAVYGRVDFQPHFLQNKQKLNALKCKTDNHFTILIIQK